MLADRVRMGSEIVKFYDTMTISSLNVGDLFYFNHLPLNDSMQWRVICKTAETVLVERVYLDSITFRIPNPVNYASSAVDNWMTTYYNNYFASSLYESKIVLSTIRAYTVSGTTVGDVNIARMMFPLGYTDNIDGLNTTNINSYYNRNGSDYVARTTWVITMNSKFMRAMAYGNIGGVEGKHLYYRTCRIGVSYAKIHENPESLWVAPACYLANNTEVLIKMV